MTLLAGEDDDLLFLGELLDDLNSGLLTPDIIEIHDGIVHHHKTAWEMPRRSNQTRSVSICKDISRQY